MDDRDRAADRRGLLPLVAGILAVVSLLPVPAAGQRSSTPDLAPAGPLLGRISGVILDASGGEPVAGATVSLEPLPHGLVRSPEGGGGGFLESMRITESDECGRYAFDRLPEASYRLRVARVGYRSATVHVDYRGSDESRVSVGLQVEPIQLDPVEVVLDRVLPMASTPTNEEVFGAERVQVELARQATYAQADVRSLTRQDVVESLTLGETDLFRALHRLPGVTAADDWSAELWTRGSRWDETRAYFDGLPLFNPIHAGGIVTGVNPDALGAVTFHPGVRPVGIGDGSAGVVDLMSRPAGGTLPVSAMGQLSMLSGRFSAESPYARGSGFTVAARRGWFDLVTEEVFNSLGDRATYYPYRLSDVAGRWDQRVSDRLAVEVSGMWSGDRIAGDLPEVLVGTDAEWGNSALRGTVETRWSSLRARLSAGGSSYRADLVPQTPDSALLVSFPDAPQPPATRNRIESGRIELTIDRQSRDAVATAWRGGVRFTTTDLAYRGPAPVPHPAGGDDGRIAHASRVSRSTAWYEHRLLPGRGVDLRLAVQADVRGFESGGSSAHLSPRVTAARALGPDARLTAGWGRHYQYEQALAGVGFDLGPRLVPTHVWVQADGAIPPIRSDIASLGAEVWLGPGVLIQGSTFLRLSSGTMMPDPAPGYVRAGEIADEHGLGAGWRSATGFARGFEVSVRRLAGRVTGSLGYSYGLAELSADDMTFPAPGDRRHSLDATVFMRLATWIRLGGAFSGTTGAPYTRFYRLSCPDDFDCPSSEGSADWPHVVGWADVVNGRRSGPYSATDLTLELEGEVLGLHIGGFVQVRNIGANRNDLAYLGSDRGCVEPLVGGVCPAGIRITDRFEDGLPVLPLIGFWARF